MEPQVSLGCSIQGSSCPRGAQSAGRWSVGKGSESAQRWNLELHLEETSGHMQEIKPFDWVWWNPSYLRGRGQKTANANSRPAQATERLSKALCQNKIKREYYSAIKKENLSHL